MPTVDALASPPSAGFQSTANPLTVPRATGLTVGMSQLIAIAFSGSATNVGTLTWPSGFVAIPGLPALIDSGTSCLAVRRKRIIVPIASEPTSYSVSWTGTSAGTYASIGVKGSTGVGVALPGSGAASLSHVAPDVTPGAQLRMLLTLLASDNVPGQTVSYGTIGSMTQIVNGGTLALPGLGVYTQALGTADGATGTRTATASQSAAYASASIIFEPAAWWTSRGGVYIPAQSVIPVGGAW